MSRDKGEDTIINDSSVVGDFVYDDEVEDESLDFSAEMVGDDVMSITGEMELGKDGHPVTVTITGEVAGAMMEINHIKSGMILVEDSRTQTSGWLTMVIGDIDKIGNILRFIAKATIGELNRLSGRGKK